MEMSQVYQSPQYTPLIRTADAPDTKLGIEELCPVCGDNATGNHFGLRTCQPCNQFFRRTVHCKMVYTCSDGRSCHIDKTRRKWCRHCRFQKCLDVGMKIEAAGQREKFGVIYNRDRARKLHMMRQRKKAVQTLCGDNLGDGASPFGYETPNHFGNTHKTKQEIQISQVSSLTSSSYNSPSFITATSLLATSQANLMEIGGSGSPAVGSSEHKLWGNANSTTPSPSSKPYQYNGALPHGSSAASAQSNPCMKILPVTREYVSMIDDEWHNSLISLLQSQTNHHSEVDLFELMCKVLDQNLSFQLTWARNSVFLKDLKFDDQVILLKHSWSDRLVLDHLHQRIHNNLPDETKLSNGQKVSLLCLGLLGYHFEKLKQKLVDLKFDVSDYVCVKFLLLLNPGNDMRGISNRMLVQDGHEQFLQALLDHCLTVYPHIQDKFTKLQQVMPEIHQLASRAEDYLNHKHRPGSAPKPDPSYGNASF